MMSGKPSGRSFLVGGTYTEQGRLTASLDDWLGHLFSEQSPCQTSHAATTSCQDKCSCHCFLTPVSPIRFLGCNNCLHRL